MRSREEHYSLSYETIGDFFFLFAAINALPHFSLCAPFIFVELLKVKLLIFGQLDYIGQVQSVKNIFVNKNMLIQKLIERRFTNDFQAVIKK